MLHNHSVHEQQTFPGATHVRKHRIKPVLFGLLTLVPVSMPCFTSDHTLGGILCSAARSDAPLVATEAALLSRCVLSRSQCWAGRFEKWFDISGLLGTRVIESPPPMLSISAASAAARPSSSAAAAMATDPSVMECSQLVSALKVALLAKNLIATSCCTTESSANCTTDSPTECSTVSQQEKVFHFFDVVL